MAGVSFQSDRQGRWVVLEIRNCNGRVVQAAVLNQLLAVPSHDALGRCEAVRIEDRRGAEERDIRSIEISAVHVAVAFVPKVGLF